MSVLPYSIMVGAVVLALVTALVGGGRYWIVPAIIVPIIAVYFVFDRRLKSRESDEEDELVHTSSGGPSGAE